MQPLFSTSGCIENNSKNLSKRSSIVENDLKTPSDGEDFDMVGQKEILGVMREGTG